MGTRLRARLYPDVLKQKHYEFVRAGSDVTEAYQVNTKTNSYDKKYIQTIDKKVILPLLNCIPSSACSTSFNKSLFSVFMCCTGLCCTVLCCNVLYYTALCCAVESCFRRYRLVLPAKDRQDTCSTAYAAYGIEVPANIQAPLSLLFRRRSILKLLRRLTMGYALPGTPLDINQKTRVLWQSLSLLSQCSI